MQTDRRTFLAAFVSASARAQARRRGPLLVQGALDFELGPLLDALGAEARRRERRIAAWSFWQGRIGRQDVVVCRTGVGPINASASTALGIREFRPWAVINQGTAGGHNRALKLWDIVLGEKTTDYAAFEAPHADAGAGVDTRAWKPKPHVLRAPSGEPRTYASFPGDPQLLAAAEKIRNPRGRVLRGNLGSAFQYNRQLDHIDWLHRAYGTDAEDMESAYAHGTALAFGVPFLAIRMISDTEWEHPVFERIAGQYCAEFVAELVRSL
ncbi:MAG: 5'-methylthioadenosine/S-adenosylhomocysteine nucleosidase [Bryobacteraceae bacterium]|nr:5'-methylthioadenosine/S-adenosylhomocysteine nucleosidase [Bryobacteraceae bacterium]